MRAYFQAMALLVALAMALVATAGRELEFDALNAAPVFKPEYTDIFYGKKPRIYLDGEWRYKVFYCSQDDYAATVEKNADRFSGAGTDWKPILIPNYADASTGSEKIGAMFLAREFVVPENVANKRFLLTFSGIGWSPVVYVNGKKVAEYRNLLPGWPTEFFQTDVTDALKTGDNVITVALFKFRKVARLFSSGIYNPVYIDIAETLYAEKMSITPRLPDSVNVKGTIVNAGDKAVEADLVAVVENWKGGGAPTRMGLGRVTLKPGANPLTFSVRIANPILWDIENPHLYSLKLLNGDKVVGWARFGLREFNVSGRDFILNGRKIHCLGIAAEEGNLARMMYIEGTNPQFLNNGGDCLRRYLTELKKNNCNSVMRWPAFTDALNNLADEIGLLQFHMILPLKMYADDMPIWVKRQIVDKKKEVPEFFSRGVFYERGEPDAKTRQKFANITKYKSGFTAMVAAGQVRRCSGDIFDVEGRNAWLKAAYEKLGVLVCNHPAVVAVLTGDEGFRDCNQAFDLPVQKAAFHSTCPGVLFTGEHSYADACSDLTGEQKDAKATLRYLDFVNPAALIGGSGMRAYPWPMFGASIKYFSEEIYRTLGRELPIFADEVFYYGALGRLCRPKLWESVAALTAKLFPNGQLDVNKMVELFSRPDIGATYSIVDRAARDKYSRGERDKAGADGNAWSFRDEIQLMGLCPELGDKKAIQKAIAGRTKKMVEQARINGRFLQGVGATTGPWLKYDMDRLAALDAAGVGPAGPIGEMFKRVYAPVFVCLDFYGCRSSMLAGETFKTATRVLNNSSADLTDLKVAVALSGEKSRAFFVEISQPRLRPGEETMAPLLIPFDYDLPTGDYRISLTLSAAGRVIAENDYEIYVFNGADAAETLASKETIYVYESYDPETRATFRRFLESLRLNAVYVPKENLLEITYYNRQPDKIKYLILSPRSIDYTNVGNLAELKPWLEKGGKLLCLEQNYEGKLPWAPDAGYVLLRRKRDYALPATAANAMPVKYSDPICRGLAARRYWESFNSPNGEMYRYLIAPLTVDAKIVGTDVSPLECPALFGALTVDRKIGEGRCVISQLEAVKALNYQDGAARKYLINLIGDWMKSGHPSDDGVKF